MSIIGGFIVPHPPLIIPEVGRGEQLKIQKTIDAYQEVAKKIAGLAPDTIIVTSPHSTVYADYFHVSPGASASGSFADFGASSVRVTVSYDEELARRIVEKSEDFGIRAGFLGERNSKLDHGTMIPLYFIQKLCPSVKIIRISISGFSLLTHYQLGICIAKAVAESEKRVVSVASGDCSHKLTTDGPYGFAKEGPVFDQQLTDAISQADFASFLNFDEDFCEAASECGLRSFVIMAGTFDGLNVKSELLSYEGPFGVGYAVGSFLPQGENDERRFGEIHQKQENIHLETLKAKEDPWVKLARRTIETYVRTRKKIARPDDLPEEMITRKAGVFVSLKMDGRLRGCIGTIKPTTDCIAEEIIQNAISSSTHDNRFDPVEEWELSKLVYSVDVLSDAEPIASFKELDPKTYGVIVRYKGRCGLLLPNLEGIDTPEKQVSIALDKGGISKNDPYRMERFLVVRHH